MITKKDVKEEDLLKLVYQRPIVGIIDSYQSFMDHKSVCLNLTPVANLTEHTKIDFCFS